MLQIMHLVGGGQIEAQPPCRRAAVIILHSMSLPIPHAINRRDDGILIEWDTTGHEAWFPARVLRLACPCAACVDEMSGRALLDPRAVPQDVRPVSLALVGAYGLQVQWSDGHGTGIYTFEKLLESCPCHRCLEARSDALG